MPRVTKKDKTDDFINEENAKVKKSVSKKTNNNSSKSVKSTKESTSVKPSTTKSTVSKKLKTEEKTKKASTKTKNASSTTSTKKRSGKSKVTPVKSILSRTRKTKKIAAVSSPALEYYDLPYRYNETVVKILSQTPSTLFVYWDISDEDRSNFIQKYGPDFFNKTKPVLVVYNKTKNYSFEVEINDFANCWYLRMQESDCEYEIELGRKSFEIFSNYVYITSSNKLIAPNDHVLFETSDFTNVKFRNVKTGEIQQKNFGSLRLLTNVGDIYNQKHKIYNFYESLYKGKFLERNNKLSNPTSGRF